MKKYILFGFIGTFIISGVLFYFSPEFYKAEVGITGYQKFEDYATRTEGSRIGKFSEEEVDVVKGDFLTQILPKLIRISIGVTASVMLIFLTISGMYLVFGGVDESFMQEAKKIFYYAIIGGVCVTISFSIVYGIANIDWGAG